VTEVVLFVGLLILLYVLVYLTIIGLRKFFTQMHVTNPRLHRSVSFAMFSLLSVFAGSLLAVGAYFYISNGERILSSITFMDDLRVLRNLLEADANILGGRFIIALGGAFLSGVLFVISIILFFILPVLSFIFISFPIAGFFDLRRELRTTKK
jgi:hypothetical protein